MSELYGPFNSGTGASFDETQWRELLGNLFTPGIVKGAKVSGSAGGDLAASIPGGNMNVNIATGVGIVYGFAYENTASLAKTLGASDATLKRIDYVVLKLDFAARTVLITVKAGTLASSPVAPALTQSSTTWEVPIATILVNNGVSALVSGNLTDMRVFVASNPAPASQGTGSGLNADFLDSLSSTAFLAVGAQAADSAKLAGFLPGSGNGVDADKVDGQHASAFLAVGGTAANSSQLLGHTVGSGGGLDADTVDGTHLAGILVLGDKSSVKVFIGPTTPSDLTKWNVWIKTPFS